MITNKQSAEVFRSFLNGSSIAEAAAAADVSYGQARSSIPRMRRRANLPFDYEAMQANPEPYLKWLDGFERDEANELRDGLRRDLVARLSLRSSTELTPKYLSNLSASRLMAAGMTTVAIAETQAWLKRHNLSLKRGAIDDSAAIREINRALLLLDAFGFDVRAASAQLDHVLSDD
jgi:hypothetical protein